jgi:ubiquitin-protein ligase
MIKEGFYEGGIFRFIIEFPNNFPETQPKITF